MDCAVLSELNVSWSMCTSWIWQFGFDREPCECAEAGSGECVEHIRVKAAAPTRAYAVRSPPSGPSNWSSDKRWTSNLVRDVSVDVSPDDAAAACKSRSRLDPFDADSVAQECEAQSRCLEGDVAPFGLPVTPTDRASVAPDHTPSSRWRRKPTDATYSYLPRINFDWQPV